MSQYQSQNTIRVATIVLVVLSVALVTLHTWGSLFLTSNNTEQVVEKLTTITFNNKKWWEDYVNNIAKPFDPYNGKQDNHDWCILPPNDHDKVKTTTDDKKNDNDDQYYDSLSSGLLFVKNYKSASSTGAGITMRIAHNLGARKLRQLLQEQNKEYNNNSNNNNNDNNNDGTVQKYYLRGQNGNDNVIFSNHDNITSICSHQVSHDFANSGGHYQSRRTNPSLLWTIVRHPVSRALSGYYYFRGTEQQHNKNKNNNNNSDKMMLPFLQSQKSFQMNFIQTMEPTDNKNNVNNNHHHHHSSKTTTTATATTTSPQQMAKQIKIAVMDSYNFIAIAERMEESLVVMKLLFDLKHSDILVLKNAKQSGNYDHNGSKCTKIPTDKVTTPEIDEYLSNDFETNNYDYLLYYAANKSLDLTIDALGRDLVQQELQQHQMFQTLIQEKCQSEAFFPCSATGIRQIELSKQSCYDQDFGCGYQCIDRVMEEYNKLMQ